MDRETLVAAVADDLVTYVMAGDLPQDDVAAVVKPPDFPDRYADFDRLVDLHFLLEDDVLAFVDTLGDRLRSIETDTRTESRVQRGGIDGRIDWAATYQDRNAKHAGNKGIYVTETHAEQYGIGENYVLKAVVNIIHAALDEVDQYLDDGRTWVADTWVGETRRRQQFRSLVERNVHLNRIPELKGYLPTDRMHSRAAESRNQLYRDAATLRERRQSYDQGDREALGQLLSDTLISPTDRDRLFELYVLFRVIEALGGSDASKIGIPTHHTISRDRSAVATFDGSRECAVYYDQTPSDPDVRFDALLDEKDPSRHVQAELTAHEITQTFFQGQTKRRASRRPDVTVVAREPESPPADYLVIEVKDSTSPKRIRQGISELVDYLAFLQRDGAYEFPSDSFGSGLNGLLVVQDLEGTDIDPAPLATQSEANHDVRIVQARHLERVLPSVITRTFVQRD
jgi:hypothetical protein